MASVSEGWAGRTGAQWRISELGEGRRFPATFRQSGVAAPARALWLSSSFRGRLHQNLPPPPTPTHTLLASLALTSTHSGTEGLESQSFSYWGARRLCASMARDGLKRKVRPFLRVPRPARRRLPPARPLFNQSCLSLSGARHMVSLLAAAPRDFPLAALRGCSDRGWRRLSIGEGAREGLRGVRVLGALTVALGAEAARSLDTCPTPSWGPGSRPRTPLWWRLETLSA